MSLAFNPQVVHDEATLLALPPGALVLADGEVYERTRQDGPNAFRCLNQAIEWREWATESAETVLWQELVDDVPTVIVLTGTLSPQDVVAVHFPCNCVPHLGPEHCHACATDGTPIAWAQAHPQPEEGTQR